MHDTQSRRVGKNGRSVSKVEWPEGRRLGLVELGVELSVLVLNVYLTPPHYPAWFNTSLIQRKKTLIFCYILQSASVRTRFWAVWDGVTFTISFGTSTFM